MYGMAKTSGVVGVYFAYRAKVIKVDAQYSIAHLCRFAPRSVNWCSRRGIQGMRRRVKDRMLRLLTNTLELRARVLSTAFHLFV